jgi:hypothetical protein
MRVLSVTARPRAPPKWNTLEPLVSTGHIGKAGGKWRPEQLVCAETSGDPQRSRELEAAWAGVATARLPSGAPGNYGCSLFSASRRRGARNGLASLRELTRVAVADTEQQWLELAQGKTARQLEELVTGKSPGDLPSSTGSPAARRHVLRCEMAPTREVTRTIVPRRTPTWARVARRTSATQIRRTSR